MYKIPILTLSAAIGVAAPTFAQHGPPTDLNALARGANRIVIATVTAVDPIFQKNDHGDELIVSRTHLRVESVLKGKAGQDEALVMEVEGGTIGELTLDVSDLPHVKRGERAVLFISQNARGANVPHGRGQGILKLDHADRVTGTSLTLAEIRAAVERAR